MTRRKFTHAVLRQPVIHEDGLSAELPNFGVALGRIVAAEACILINNRMLYAHPDAIAVLPIRIAEDGERCYFFRPEEPSVPITPTSGDIGTSVASRIRMFLQPVDDWDSGVHPEDTSMLHLRGEQSISVLLPISCWNGADGVLFAMISGELRDPKQPAMLDSARAATARVLGEMLEKKNVRRCVVPRIAIEQLARLTADPQPTDSDLCFAVASCQYTAGLIDATPPADDSSLPSPGPADVSYARLAERMQGSAPPQLLILAGDQVYVDGDAGLFDPSTFDDRFRRPYEQLFSSVYVQDVTRQIPICAILDDHELQDNWENETELQEVLVQGRRSYIDFQRLGGLLREPNGESDRLWDVLHFGGYEFFFADTRTRREKRTVQNFSAAQLIDADQWRALREFLLRPNPERRPRFVISPSILIPRRLSTATGAPASVLQSDAWDGYPATFDALFSLLAEHQIQHVFFLSGDEHRCCVSIAECATGPAVVRSIHSSGMYAPFRFANGIPENFSDDEELQTGNARWRFASNFLPAGQGFALIQIRRTNATWTVTLTHDLEPYVPPDPRFSWSWPS